MDHAFLLLSGVMETSLNEAVNYCYSCGTSGQIEVNENSSKSMKTSLQVHQVTWRNDLTDSLQRKDTEIETSQKFNEAYGQESSSLGQANMGSTSTYHKVIVIHMGIQDRQLTLITIHCIRP